jgi:hypothetical protein
MDVIAEHKLLALYPDGTASPVCLRVGRPEPRSDGDWVCPVQGEGLRLWEGPTELFGVGSWHALMIGLRFLREILASEVRQGAVLHWEGGEHSTSVDELFVLHEID